MRELAERWQLPLNIVGCDSCDQLYLAPDTLVNSPCPNCPNQRLDLVAAESINESVLVPPELVVPFTVSAETVTDAIETFAGSYLFTPKDLSAHILQQRMQRVLLPMYLVDSDVSAQWQAEVGFNYDVVSHVEQYRSGSWHTTQTNETRIRWEPRVGVVNRHYENVRAPALENHDEILENLGAFQTWQTEPYQATNVLDALIHLPDRAPEDAWVDAEPLLLQRVEKECIMASDGQHIRQFHWHPTIANKHWTKLLLPTYITFYLDDNGKRIPVVIHGRSGKLSGEKIGSYQIARRTAIALALAAILCFVLYLVGLFVTTTGPAPILLFLAIALAVATILPFAYVHNLNK